MILEHQSLQQKLRYLRIFVIMMISFSWAQHRKNH